MRFRRGTGHASSGFRYLASAPPWPRRIDRVVAAARRRNAARSALPEPRSGRRSSRTTLSGVLKVGDAPAGEPTTALLEVERRGGLDEGGHALAHEGVGVPDGHGVADVGVRLERGLHLGGRDVLAAPDDHVLQAAHDAQPPSLSTVARSPVWNQPPRAMTAPVWAGSAYRRTSRGRAPKLSGVRAAARPVSGPTRGARRGRRHVRRCPGPSRRGRRWCWWSPWGPRWSRRCA